MGDHERLLRNLCNRLLIEGEKGTGKKLIAQTIHELSLFSTGPFIVIDCAALSEDNFDNRIFREKEETFSKGNKDEEDLIGHAQGRTIFFNQIAELAPSLQSKFISLLLNEEIQYKSGLSVPKNSRIIASSDINLKQAMEDGHFKSDLFFHINANYSSISVPPLRERDEDILLLANAFLKKYSGENRRKFSGFTTNACDSLERYSWPGNVRELESRIKRAIIMAEGKKITHADLELEMSVYPTSNDMNLKEARKSLEKELLLKALARNKNNLTKAASDLGISRPTLYDLMEKFGIPPEFLA